MSKRKRRGRSTRKVTNVRKRLRGISPSGFSVADLVLENIESGKLKLPKPAIPVPIRNPEHEWQAAKQEQVHYFKQSQINQRPWFQCPKTSKKYSEDVLCNREMMEAALNHNPGNRNIKTTSAKEHIEAIAHDILNGNWLGSHQSIAFDLAGNFFDGQHRANGLIRSCEMAEELGRNEPEVIFYVTFNAPPEARAITDTGSKRTSSQQVKYVFPDAHNKWPSIAGAMMRGADEGRPRFSEPEKFEFIKKHHDALRSVVELLKGCGNPRADVYAAMAKLILWYGDEAIPALQAFCERFKTELFFGHKDPAKLFSSYITDCKIKTAKTGHIRSADEVYSKALTAMDAAINGRELQRLNPRPSDVFEWILPGWDVPQE